MTQDDAHTRVARAGSRTRAAARGIASVALLALLSMTVVALAGNDPRAVSETGTGLAIDSETPSAAPTTASPATPPSGTPTGASSPAPDVPTQGTAVPTVPTAGAPPTGEPDPTAPATPGDSSHAPTTDPTTAPTPTPRPSDPGSTPPDGGESQSESTAVVSPTLQLLAFGGQVGLPLVCSVTSGAVGPALTNPALAQIVAEIQAGCVEYANQGADALRQLDEDLAALAAVNPAVRPLLDQLATALDEASTADAPFATYLRQMSALVRFFEGS